MCGIVGYIGNRQAGPILLEAIRKLEYRGYDSVGIACLDGKEIHTRKDIGKIDEVDARLKLREMTGSIGIAHSRWATHGQVTRENAHPHFGALACGTMERAARRFYLIGSDACLRHRLETELTKCHGEAARIGSRKACAAAACRLPFAMLYFFWCQHIRIRF